MPHSETFACRCGRSFLVTFHWNGGHAIPVFWSGEETAFNCPDCNWPLLSQYRDRPTPPTADRDKRIGSGGVLNSQQSRSAVGDGGTSPASPPLSSPGRYTAGREVHIVASEPLEISPAYARREV